MAITIQAANLDDPDFAALIDAHARLMLSLSPPGSCHFLPMDGLRNPRVTVWEIRDDEKLVGSGALQELSMDHGEIKSMHTLRTHRGQGHGRRMLEHILGEARQRQYRRLSLETGSMAGFAPATRLYQQYGFEACPPFGDYKEDPNSLFMTLQL